MNKSVMMIMGGALVVAIIVAMLVQAKLSPKSEAAAGAGNEVLVARKNLPIGTQLKAEHLRWQPWPESASYKGLLRKKDYPDDEAMQSLYGTPLRRAVEGGEPLTRQAIIADIKSVSNFLAASLEPGMRAVAISVKADTSVGGFAAAGDRVDVILAYAPDRSGGFEGSERIVQAYASQTVLSDVRVLAVDQKSEGNEREAKVGKTVTLEVSSEGAQVLALAQRMGDITLALRRIGEKDRLPLDEYPLTTDVTTSNVLRQLQRMRGGGGDTSTVRVYSGSNINNVSVPRETFRAEGGKQ